METKHETVTPAEALADVVNELEQGNVESVTVIYTLKDGEIKSAHSNQRTTQVIGQLELVKHNILTEWSTEE